MRQSTSQKRPWLAALLATLATGLGHLYLRRWRRALGWFVALFGATVLFVDPATLDALASRESVDLLSVAPILVVGSLSVVDAYVLARAQNAMAQLTATADGELTHCPNCGREVDPELDFCQWCTTDLGEFEVTSPDERDAY